MKKIVLFLGLTLLLLAPTFAENVDLTRAQHVAHSFLQSKMGRDPDIHLIDYADRSSFNHFYVFGNDHCFVIVSADDRVTPIIGYSNENGFGQTAMPENVFSWLKAYDDEVSMAISRHMDATEEIQSEWHNLMNGNGLEPKSRSSVSPLVLTMWDQTEPYNNLCPSTSGGPGDHAYAGCVATAMAQIMNYWEHPVKGTGNHSYSCPNYGQLSANFASTTYDWDHMKNSYSMGYTSTEATAVATLIYHCGISVDMAYGTGNNGSAAYSSDVADALKTYFSYATTTQYYYKSSYSDSQWINLLKTELNNGRPVLYNGQSSDGGHSFICDGYNESNQFHFNWGWSGFCNGYYAIGALNPGPGGSGSGSQGQYNTQNGAVMGCQPATPSINPPTNVNSSVNGRNVTITWTGASGAVSYKVYRDGNLIAGSVTGTSYTDSNVNYGVHVYYLKSVASNGTMSLQSATTTADVHFAGPVPTNLQGSPNGSSANLSWTAPASETAILQYGTGTAIGGIGYNGAADTYWAQRYPVSTLTQYAGMAINKVSVYFMEAGSYTLYIYKGNEVGTTELVQQKSYTASGTGWKDITLTTYAIVDYTQDLWVVMQAPSSISYPAAYCSYSGSGVADACYVSYSGDSWQQFNSSASWLIKTYMTDGTYTYRVYRNNSAVATNVSGTTYTDSGLTSGTYSYYVTTNYYGGESDASNTVSVVIGGTQSYNISVSADPTDGGNVTGGGSYNSGQSCTVTATPNTGYTFVNWTKNGQQVSTNASYTFTVTESATYVAHFQIQSYTITVSADPTAGGSVNGGGTFNHGQSCTLTATPNTGYTFVNWTKNGQQVSTNASYTFTVTESATYVAHFQIQNYTISVSADPTAGGSVSGGGTFNHGQSCTLTATPNTGYTFVNWTKNGQQVSTNASYTFTVTESATYIAHFQIQSYTITVSADPTAGGSVNGGGTFNHGQSCTLTATPNTGYTFVNWTKNGQQVSTNASYTFTVTESATYIAHFQIQSYTITVSADPTAGGSVSGGGTFNHGQSCTLTATPNTGYTFVNWTKNGQQVSTNASYTFTVTESATYIAHFQIQSYTISVSADPTTGGSVSGGGTFNHGQSCTLIATPNTGYTFVNWTKNGQQVSTNASYTFTVTESATYIAHFQIQSYTISVSADPNAGGSVSGGGTFNYGQTCTVHAMPNTGYTFVNWTENGTQVSTNANYSFDVTSNRTLVAHFSMQSYVITAVADPTEGGTVHGSGGYNYGDNCTLTASANTGYTFVNWTKNGNVVSTNTTYSFSVTESATYVAHFLVQSYTVSLTADPEVGGSVSGGGTFNYGQSCTIRATVNEGYTFVNWTENGNPVSNNADYTFTVEGDRNLTANFSIVSFVITAIIDPENGGSITGTGSYDYGETCTLSIEPYENYTFINWTEDGIEVSAEPNFSFTVESSHSFVAHLLYYDGLNETTTTIEFYPNPVDDWLHIEGKDLRKAVVINALGQVMKSIEIENSEELLLNLRHFEPAVYTIMIYTDRGVVMKKLVKR